MKRKGILFSILSVMCVGLASGCNEDPSYYVEAAVNNKEYGYAVGTGNYKLGGPVMIKFYPNLGCDLNSVKFEKASDDPIEVSASRSNDGYYYLNQTLTADNAGKYTAQFECTPNDPNQLADQNAVKYDVRFVLFEQQGPSTYVDYNQGLDEEDKVYFDKLAQGELVYDNIEKVTSGNKVNNGDPLEYHDKLDGKVVWYTKDPSQSGVTLTAADIFDFGTAITGAVVDENDTLTLYGVYNPSAATEFVVDALNKFNNSDKMSVTEIRKKWYMGTEVSDAALNVEVEDATLGPAAIGDLYFNESSWDLYTLGMNGSWQKKYNVKEEFAHHGVGTSRWCIGEACSSPIDGDIYLDTESSDETYPLKVYDSSNWISVEELNPLSSRIYLSGATISSGDDKLSIVIREVEGSLEITKGNLSKGKYYAYDFYGNKAGFELAAADLGIENIPELYKYFELAEIDSTKLKTTASDPEDIIVTKRNAREVVLGASCSIFDLSKSGEIFMTLYINKGTIYKVVTKDVAVTYNYETTDNEDPISPLDMYLVRLYTNNDTLRDRLTGYSDDYDTILKVVPGYGETLTSAIKEDKYLTNVLKEYDYDIKVGKDSSGVCSTNSYISTSVRGHLDLCIEVKAEFADVEEAIRNTGVELITGGETKLTGKFGVTTSTIVFDEPYEKKADVSDVSVGQPTGMNKFIWDSLVEMARLTNVDRSYGRFEYVKKDTHSTEYVYKFYETVESTSPYLSIQIGDDGRVSELVYFEYSSKGEITTYTSKFDYSKYDTLNLINEVGNGGYILNSSITVEEDDYFALAEQGEVNATMWELVGILKSLNSNIGKFNYNNATHTYEYVDDNGTPADDTDDVTYTYVFTLDGEKVTKLVYSKTGEADKEYNISYINRALNALKTSSYDVDVDGSTLAIESAYFAAGATKPEGMEQSEWDAIVSFVSKVLSLEEDYTFDGNNTFSYTDDKGTPEDDTDDVTYTCAFTLDDEKLTKLVYSVTDEEDVEYNISYSE